MSSFSCLWKNNISSPASSKTHCLRYRVLRSNIRCRRQPEPTDLRHKECLRSHQTQASGCRSYSFSMSSSRHCLSHIPTAYTKIPITPLLMLLLVVFSSLSPCSFLFSFRFISYRHIDLGIAPMKLPVLSLIPCIQISRIHLITYIVQFRALPVCNDHI